jgi:hypothetical protein
MRMASSPRSLGVIAVLALAILLFINVGDLPLCTLDGVCVIVYVKFSSVGAGTVWGGGSSLHPLCPNFNLG